MAKSMERKTKHKYTKKTCSYKNPSYINVFCESLKTLHNKAQKNNYVIIPTILFFHDF